MSDHYRNQMAYLLDILRDDYSGWDLEDMKEEASDPDGDLNSEQREAIELGDALLADIACLWEEWQQREDDGSDREEGRFEGRLHFNDMQDICDFLGISPDQAEAAWERRELAALIEPAATPRPKARSL